MNKKMLDGLRVIEGFWTPRSYEALLKVIQGLVEMVEAKPEVEVEDGWREAIVPLEPVFEPKEGFIYSYPNTYGYTDFFMFRVVGGIRRFIELEDMETFIGAVSGKMDNDIKNDAYMYSMEHFNEECPDAATKAKVVMDISCLELT